MSNIKNQLVQEVNKLLDVSRDNMKKHMINNIASQEKIGKNKYIGIKKAVEELVDVNYRSKKAKINQVVTEYIQNKDKNLSATDVAIIMNIK